MAKFSWSLCAWAAGLSLAALACEPDVDKDALVGTSTTRNPGVGAGADAEAPSDDDDGAMIAVDAGADPGVDAAAEDAEAQDAAADDAEPDASVAFDAAADPVPDAQDAAAVPTMDASADDPADASDAASASGSDAQQALPLPPTALLDDAVTGVACTARADCAGEGARCARAVGGITAFRTGITAVSAPGGYCTGDCFENADCGSGAACVGALKELFAVGECQKVCDSAADCREGYACMGLGLLGGPQTCLPPPQVDSTLESGVAGRPCDGPEACDGGLCAGRAGFTACTGLCYENADCGEGAVCLDALPNPLLSIPGSCAQVCQANEDCLHPEYQCTGRLFSATRTCQAPPPPPPPPPATDAGAEEGSAELDAGMEGALDASTAP